MDLRPLEVKPLKGQLTGSIKTKIPELVRRRQTPQREHFILKPKEAAVWASRYLPQPPHQVAILETLGWAWERKWEQGQKIPY